MVRNILFDFGNVLASFDKHPACKEFAKYSTLDAEGIYKVLVGSDLEKSFESGHIDPQQFARAAIAEIHAPQLLVTRFLDLWADIFSPNPGMVELLKELHQQRNVRIAVVSTTNALHWPYMQKLEAIKLLQRWNIPFILSHNVGVIKPDEKMFRAGLSALNATAEDTILVDDLPKNIEAGKKIGMQTVLYDCTKQSIEDLREALECLLN